MRNAGLIIPEDLKQVLESNQAAKKNFEGFNKSSKKSILFWISSAKRQQTRLKRIEKTVNSAAENKNPLA